MLFICRCLVSHRFNLRARNTKSSPTTLSSPSLSPRCRGLISSCSYNLISSRLEFHCSHLYRWSTYAIVAGILGAIGYYSYLSFVPQPKRRKTPAVSAPVVVTATGAGGYQEEWIPEHHLKKPKTRKTRAGVATSGEETSGTELSGTEGRKRKGKK